MMTDQHLPLLEATPMLAEMPLHPHMLSRDGMQQVSDQNEETEIRDWALLLFVTVSSENTLRKTNANV